MQQKAKMNSILIYAILGKRLQLGCKVPKSDSSFMYKISEFVQQPFQGPFYFFLFLGGKGMGHGGAGWVSSSFNKIRSSKRK